MEEKKDSDVGRQVNQRRREEKKDDVERQLHLKRRNINNDLLRRFKKKGVPVGKKGVYKTGKKLTRKLKMQLPHVPIHDFYQTPETVVKIMAIFCKSYALPMPQEILQLIVTFSTPSFLRVNGHQGVVFKNCHGINVKLRGKGKQVLISNCSDLNLQVEDLISSLNVFDCERLNITTVGELGVPAYIMENSSDVNVRFRDDSLQTVFSVRSPKGRILAAAFSKGEDLVEFSTLKKVVLLSNSTSAVRWSSRNGWQVIDIITGEWTNWDEHMLIVA